MNHLDQRRSRSVLLATLIAFFLLSSSEGMAVDVRLDWDACTWPGLVGYKVYYGTASKWYNKSIDAHKLTTYTVTGLESITYYFAVTAYDSAGVETAFSNEVSTPGTGCGKECNASGGGSVDSNDFSSPGLIQIIPHVVESSEMRSNLGINNVSDGFATVTVRLINENGTEVAAKPFIIPPRGLKQVNRVIAELKGSGNGSSFEGYLLLDSNLPIEAWVSEIDNVTNDPGIVAGKTQGSANQLIGSTSNFGVFRSSLAFVNTGDGPTNVTITLRSADGKVRGGLKDLEVPAHGFYNVPNILESLGITYDFGSLEVVSSDGQPLIATSRVYTSSGTSGFFNNATSAHLTLIVPHVMESSKMRSNLGINNVSDGYAAVKVRLINENGTEVAAKSFAIPPRGLKQVNRVITELKGSGNGSSFEGYLLLDSNLPIEAWVSEIDDDTNDPSFVLGRNQGVTHLIVGSSTNVGVFKSSLMVVNTGSSDASVDVVIRDAQGIIQGGVDALAIPAHGFYSTPSILESLGVSENFGPLELISTNGQPLVAVSRVYSNSGTSGFFEGHSIE